jgi:hypothetical protein
MDNDQESRQFSLLMCLIFVASAAFLMVHHEMWRDEISTWLLTKNIGSLKELFLHLQNELHPFLWYVLVYPLKFVARNPEIMKPLHLLIASVTVYIFCRNAPFSRLNKLLFIFGYFPFFEYGVITRNYSLILLFSVLLTAIYIHQETVPSARKAGLLGLTIGIFLICQTHIFGVFIGGIFAFLLAWDVFLKREKMKLLPLMGFLSGVAIFLVQIWPMNNWQVSSFGYRQGFDGVLRALQSVWRGFLPLPFPYLHFWNTNILDINNFFFNVQYLLGLFVLFGSIGFIINLREVKAVLFYCIGAFVCLSFIYFTFYNQIRFYGIIFILFILSLWIAYGLQGKLCNGRLLSLLLLFHVIATSVAFYYDMKYPFSASKKVAVFIKNLEYNDFIIVGHRDTPVSPLAAYLNTEIYYIQEDRFGTFYTWAKTRLVNLKFCEVIQKAIEIRDATGKPVLLVLNYFPREEEIMFKYSLFQIGQFPTSIVAQERYSIWIMK